MNNSIGLVAIALGILLSAIIASTTADKFRIARQTLTVKGYAEQSIVADIGVWTSTLTVRANDLATGSQKMQMQLAQVKQFLSEQSIPESSIQINGVNLVPQYELNSQGIPSNVLAGYQLSQQIVITDKPVVVQNLDQHTDKLTEQGIEISSWAPQYYYTELDKVRIVMLGEAMKDAKKRAQTLADNSGGTLGTLRSAQQGVFQITPEYSTETSDSGFSDTSAINKKIKAVVTAQFSIEK